VLSAPLLSQAYGVTLQVMKPEGGGTPFIAHASQKSRQS